MACSTIFSPRRTPRTSRTGVTLVTFAVSHGIVPRPSACAHKHVYTRVIRVSAGKDVYKGDSEYEVTNERYLSMRAEVEAPFRTFRIFILGFFMVSATVATLVATSQLIGAVGNAPNARPLQDCLQTWGLDIASFVGLGLLLRKDWGDREKQLTRMGREERLGACKVELANGKTMQLGRLRGFCRPVIVAGTSEQVAAALEAAEPFKEELMRRGVFVVGLPVFGGEAAAGRVKDASSLKWEGTPIRMEDWKTWFESQAGAANAKLEKGLYIGLRLDGRVRASGTGIPPWNVFAAQIAPMEGMWGSVFDGMDGRVGE